MEHEHNSFKDLAFLLPDTVQLQDIMKTIIYADDLEILTAMLWFFLERLSTLRLPVSLIDILHAGLSQDHEQKCLTGFSAGTTKFLLALEKVGAGINFAEVSCVIQYLTRGLTLVRWVQRQGHGARDPGSTVVGIILVEKKMQHNRGLSPDMPGNEDAGLLELVQTTCCCQAVLDRWLENPTRSSEPSHMPPAHLCCSNCHPILSPPRECLWIMENPTRLLQKARSSSRRITDDDAAKIFIILSGWCLDVWRNEWRDSWPGYGPKSLIPDTDLQKVAKNAMAIDSLDTLRPLVHILHWSELADELLIAVNSAVTTVIGDTSEMEVAGDGITSGGNLLEPGITSTDTSTCDVVEDSKVGVTALNVGKLQPWEHVLKF